MRHVKVALIQLHPKPLQVENNFSKAKRFIEQAAAEGADLAVVPEYCLTNWLPKDPNFLDVVRNTHDDYLKRFQDLAKANKINIVPGTIVKPGDPLPNGKKTLYNVTCFISRDGEILGKYSKRNLWGAIEREHLEPGKEMHKVVCTEFGPIGLLICWGLAFPEAFRQLIAQGAKLVIIPTFWTLNDCTDYGLKMNPKAEELFMNSTVVTRAFENACGIIFVNSGGPSEKGYAGCSQLTVPFAGAIAKTDGATEKMVIGTVDLDVLEEAEKAYSVKADLTSEKWGYPAGSNSKL